MSQRRPLDVIQVSSPCLADWERMVGDARRRFCTHCNKFVQNPSAMPTEQAERIVCENAGDLCVRFATDPTSGHVVTLDYAPRARPSRRRALATIVSIAAALWGAGSWGAYKLLRKPPAVQMPVIMAAIAASQAPSDIQAPAPDGGA